MFFNSQELFPKSQLDVYVTVLDPGVRGGGEATGAAVTAAGLALASGGIPMLDLLVGASSSSGDGGSSLVVGYLPHLEQVQLLHMDGGLRTAAEAAAATERLLEECVADGVRVRECLLKEAAAKEEEG